jgi:hypothetical protein
VPGASGLPSLAGVDVCAASIREIGPRQLNMEQRSAVASILLQAGGRAPYALFGPPGTGKTVTLVECALQVDCMQDPFMLLLVKPLSASSYSCQLQDAYVASTSNVLCHPRNDISQGDHL